MKGTVLHINGGLGKCIMATAVAREFKRERPDQELIIVSGYPEVFLHNPNVDGNYPFQAPDLWKRFYGNPEYDVVAHDPYMDPRWIRNEEIHLTQLWCDLFGIDCLNHLPELYFSGPELDEVNSMVQIDKPLLFVQSTGGADAAKRSWTRNPPQKEFEEYLARFNESHYILHVCVPNTPELKNIHQRIDVLNRRQAMALAYYAHEMVAIDSYAMHVRAANPDAGPTHIFLPLKESQKRLGYDHKSFNWLTPTDEVNSILQKNCDYYATIFKYSIENLGENCPVPPEYRWFEF